jgi:hypothetical protein
MGRKARDPEQTGTEPTPPWRPADPCPCGGDNLYAQCCLGIDGRAYKTTVGRRPNGLQTGFSHPRCYMGWTQDCDQKISGEHFISATVLNQLGGPKVKLNGVPWIPTEETKILPIASLTGNILCQRHNGAFSNLDATGGKLFAALKLIHDDIFNKKTLSMRCKWLLCSGEELELWLLKTAIGLFHSGNVARNKTKLSDTQIINPSCYNVLYDGTLAGPCGVYVEPVHLAEQINQFQLQPLSDDSGQRIVGLRMSYLSFALMLLFDSNATYGSRATEAKTYRPSYLMVRNSKRNHTVMLTWPPTTSTTWGVVRVSF